MFSENKSILVIEDEELVRNSIVELLSLKGHKVVTAENGHKGLQVATEERPDLILSDIMMPDISGLEVLEMLKTMPETSTIPFIFLTAKAEKTDFRRGMELGADDYLAKPFTKKELYNAIETQLTKYHNINQIHEHKVRDLKLSLSVSLPHELRTPLNGIHSAAHFLLNNAKSIDLEDRIDLYKSIANSSKRLNRFIQNYLLYTELEMYDKSAEKKLTVSLRNCSLDPDDTIQTAIANMKDFENYTGPIATEFNHQSEFAILIKPDHLLKITEELISNAFKFHQESEKAIVISSSISENENRYILAIENRGNPLSKQEIDSISSYVQFGRERNEQQGLGLGLFIVKSLVNIYDGTLSIDSLSGKGNRFIVKLPITNSLEELN